MPPREFSLSFLSESVKPCKLANHFSPIFPPLSLLFLPTKDSHCRGDRDQRNPFTPTMITIIAVLTLCKRMQHVTCNPMWCEIFSSLVLISRTTDWAKLTSCRCGDIKSTCCATQVVSFPEMKYGTVLELSSGTLGV